MRNEPTSEVEKHYPPSQSASPYNAYYLKGCEAVARSPNYASCLFKINEYERGAPVTYAEECNQAISKGACQAVGMRDEEELKGVAMYFYPSTVWRNRMITNLTPEDELLKASVANKLSFVSNDPRAANFKGRYQEYVPKQTKPSATSLAPAAKSVMTISDDGYTAAINAAMKELPPTPVPATLKPAIHPGESPLQFARRIAALHQ